MISRRPLLLTCICMCVIFTSGMTPRDSCIDQNCGDILVCISRHLDCGNACAHGASQSSYVEKLAENLSGGNSRTQSRKVTITSAEYRSRESV